MMSIKKVSNGLDYEFANYVVQYIVKDFTDKHLTGSTVQFTTCHKNNYYTTVVEVAPPAYSQYEYIKKHQLIRDYSFSYAINVNLRGSTVFKKHIGNHKNFLSNSLVYAAEKIGGTISGLNHARLNYERGRPEFTRYKK